MTTAYLLPLSEITQLAIAGVLLPSVQAQAARIQQANGLTVICTSDPNLSGIYPADDATVASLLGVQYFIDRNARFPGGTGQYVVADISGDARTFNTALVSGGGSPPAFTQLVYALADFAALCNAIAITGTGALPSATANIA